MNYESYYIKINAKYINTELVTLFLFPNQNVKYLTF